MAGFAALYFVSSGTFIPKMEDYLNWMYVGELKDFFVNNWSINQYDI